jgi:UDP-2,3-diacylglucosamine pyrophosphatase LpxH
MVRSAGDIELPRYRGQQWIAPRLPEQGQAWLLGGYKSIRKERNERGAMEEALQQVLDQEDWKWPQRTVYFFSDPHADCDAFIASLVASGGVKKTGPGDADFKLTRAGRKARFLIGGDCFDKGPSNLRLLRMIRLLMDAGARVKLLAGNHDIRMQVGIRSLELPRDPRTEHFFIRMGPKAVPFLKEISDQYLQGKRALRGVPDSRTCRRKLFPRKRWFREFPQLARWSLHEQGLEGELKKLRQKLETFESGCKRAGLSMRRVYAATRQWRRLFLHPKGEFYWFYREMKAVHREGSFLFIHAGLDDQGADIITGEGVKHLNRQFYKLLQQDLFEFYYGPVANIIRTKYRESDRPLTQRGVRRLHRDGVHAIVHGHVHRHHGQRIMLRKGMLNFECDATIDAGTRRKEGLQGPGAAVTIFRPDKTVLGISTDYPYVKVFDPKAFSRHLKGARKS